MPGCGYQLSPERVLAEMCDAGLGATELGPEGFLPADADALAVLLREYGLSCAGTFAPVLLHDAGHDPVPAHTPCSAARSARTCDEGPPSGSPMPAVIENPVENVGGFDSGAHAYWHKGALVLHVVEPEGWFQMKPEAVAVKLEELRSDA